MIDIPSIFKNKTLDADKLRKYGFTSSQSGFEKSFPIISQSGFEKSFPIMKKQYKVIVSIMADGTADFRVFDCEAGEEYILAHVYNSTGSFVSEVHKECEEILKDIALKCYITEYFKWEQSKRILQFIKDSYNAEPEFLWSSLPECAALRAPGKKPWFAVIGRVKKEKFGLEEAGVVEVINLKDEPKYVKAHIESGIAMPAYHMNKQHWYTLFLDDTLTDNQIHSLVMKSYSLVNN